jgi:hypothetical protein
MVSGPKVKKLTQYIGEQVPRAEVKNRSKPKFPEASRHRLSENLGAQKIT